MLDLTDGFIFQLEGDKMLDIFCLTDIDGNLLAPSVQSTVLAKYSRSALSARDIVKTLTPEEADKFQDKWFVTWGHSSVAELSTIPICFEGVSIIASKFIEKYQRPGYSEKSTRYQDFSSSKSFVVPPGAPDTLLRFVDRFYSAYKRLQPRVFEICAKKTGKDINDPKTKNDKILQARVFDNLRYLLPAGTGTSLGMCANGRDIRYLIRDAISSKNPEIILIGQKTLEAVKNICPPFVNNIKVDNFEPDIYFINSSNPMDLNGNSRVNLIDNGSNFEEIEKNFKKLVEQYYRMNWEQFSNLMDSRGDRPVPKIFRKIRLSFDVIMDYGAYRDLQRHRRCEQFPEVFSTVYGYEVPDDIIGTDVESDYRRVMDSAVDYVDTTINSPELNQYHIPLGYLHRTIFDLDLEELYYLVELRTRPQGHISYRRKAYEMFQKANDVLPSLMKWCRAVNPIEIGDHK